MATNAGCRVLQSLAGFSTVLEAWLSAGTSSLPVDYTSSSVLWLTII